MEKQRKNKLIAPVARVLSGPIGNCIGTVVMPGVGTIIGGIIGSTFGEVITSTTEGKFVERRLKLIENYLGPDIEQFNNDICNLSEKEHYSIKRLIKFHCFKAPPELTDITAKAIIDYIKNSQTRNVDDIVITSLCQLSSIDIDNLKDIKQFIYNYMNCDYNATIQWNRFMQKYKITINTSPPKEQVIQSSKLISHQFDYLTKEQNFRLNSKALSFSHLANINIIHKTNYSNFNGANSSDIKYFVLTPIGKKIMKYIDK